MEDEHVSARRRRSTGGRVWTFRVAAVVIGCLAGGMLIELGLRLKVALFSHDPGRRLQRTAVSPPPAPRRECSATRGASLGQLIRPAREPDVIYRLKPLLDTCFFGVRVRTNRQGLRGPREYRIPKPPGTFRILFLGDSQTFGHGVAFEDTFIERLRAALQRRSALKVEVINTGVSGYNTAQEAAYLRHFGLRYQPDCIAILFIGNDLGLPQFLLEPRDALDDDRSLLWDKLVAATKAGTEDRPLRLVAGGLDGFVSSRDLERVPRSLCHLAGFAGHKRALARIALLAEKIPVVNFADYRALPGRRAEIAEHAIRMGILLPKFRFPAERENWLSETDGHMNVAGHEKLARRMLRGFREVGACIPPPSEGPARTPGQ